MNSLTKKETGRPGVESVEHRGDRAAEHREGDEAHLAGRGDSSRKGEPFTIAHATGRIVRGHCSTCAEQESSGSLFLLSTRGAGGRARVDVVVLEFNVCMYVYVYVICVCMFWEHFQPRSFSEPHYKFSLSKIRRRRRTLRTRKRGRRTPLEEED